MLTQGPYAIALIGAAFLFKSRFSKKKDDKRMGRNLGRGAASAKPGIKDAFNSHLSRKYTSSGIRFTANTPDQASPRESNILDTDDHSEELHAKLTELTIK